MTEQINSLAAALSRKPSTTAFKRTAEVRWFYEGEPSAPAVAWFRDVAGGDVLAAERSDLYLLTGRGDVNVKHREGRLEVKRRPAGGRKVLLGEGVEGIVERWDKWIQPGPDSRLDEGGAGMMAIRKARRLITLDVNGEVARIRPGQVPERSCNVELTRIGVLNRVWWSICLESAGPEPELEQLLLRAARHAFSLSSVPDLDARHSAAYSDWLLHLDPST